MKISIYLFCCIIISFLHMSCFTSAQNDEEWVQIVMQPKVEIGKSTTILIYFKEKPDAGSLKFNVSENDFKFEDYKTIENEIVKEGENYVYKSNYEFNRLGKLSFPIIEIKIKGKTYQSKPYEIEVVENVQINTNSILTELETDKSNYSINDTITLQLNQYSKFMEILRLTPKELVKLGAPERLFAIVDEGTVDYKVGILSFENYINEHFEVISFDWNPTDFTKTMQTKNNEIFIKNNVFTIKLKSKEKGDFKIGESNFDFEVRTDDDVLINHFKKDELDKIPRINVKSNVVEFTVN